jgi:hypothetical protein
MKKNVLISCFMVIAACSAKQRETFAHITQRRLDKHGKLMISYQFRDGDKLVYDSMEVPNSIIPHDSVRVVFASGNSSESHLLLP